MSYPHGRGQGGQHDARPPSARDRHPNWGHPDHDACGTGFIARLGGAARYDIVEYALTALEKLTHRGGVDADGASGDGAGLLTGIPHAFFTARAAEQGIELPQQFGLGVAFLPAEEVSQARSAIEEAAETERLRLLGWRQVPTNPACLGRRAMETMPEIWQFFVAPFHPARGDAKFEPRLSLMRKRAESLMPARCYICSLSSQSVVYKGFEVKLLQGFSPEEGMLAMAPPAFENDPLLSRDVRAALSALSLHSEPWDGPAALIFSDGQVVGAKLDRNGLRPLRYTVTHDGLVVAGSETGLVDFEESRIAERPRLGPGEMIVANPATGTLFRWREILKRLATQQSRRPAQQTRRLGITAAASPPPAVELPQRVAAACGWTADPYKILFSRLLHGKESDWSMGDDAPPAFLSSQLRTLWDYCKQRFAQVTNPPIDPLRETHVMSLEVSLPQGITLTTPILTQAELEELLEASRPVHREPFSFPSTLGVPGARRAVAQLTTPLSAGARPGLFLLSDRGVDGEHAVVPALLATAAFWKRMVEDGYADVPLIVETAQAFDTHHVALLLAAGATAVVPYLAEQFAEAQEAGGMAKVRTAITAGLREELGGVGVSALASHRAKWLFLIVGLPEQLRSDFFEDAAG